MEPFRTLGEKQARLTVLVNDLANAQLIRSQMAETPPSYAPFRLYLGLRQTYEVMRQDAFLEVPAYLMKEQIEQILSSTEEKLRLDISQIGAEIAAIIAQLV